MLAAQAFATTANASSAYGNLYAFRNDSHGNGWRPSAPRYRCHGAAGRPHFALTSYMSWYTGGSGVLLPRAVVATIANATQADVDAWSFVGERCR